MTRLPLIAGNWKMNLDHREAVHLTQKLAFSLPEKYFAKVEVALLPPFTSIRSVGSVVEGEKMLLRFGAQDLSPHDSGAYTGDVSGMMLARLGCSYVVVGHSERREYHGEDDELVAAKVRAALKHELTPILCVGEKIEVREQGTHVEHCNAQLTAALAGLPAEAAAKVVIAYEPVWAIGTGRVATPADAQEVCAALRAQLGALYDPALADGIRILYGGSVKSNNIADLVAQTDIDGALVGGASLDGDDFAKLCALAAGGPL
ncbi:MAG TPA: triose-phosphate isomerase [Actinophytocola sp.]|uniref:triose-phosphate isomerase n=1 Tax=Actinophytocola sp. TaxID=1872138 RepID=UPI002DDD5BF5|nr:triose-phosphate isomerase [Actinophytocola sp.]HEV2780826.1 triose-phosphate isomerase [Actinophytocola sp.]